MKNLRRIAYIILILVIIGLSFAVYTNASQRNDTTQKDKNSSEIQYIETKFIDLFNSMNNIQTDNYDIQISGVSQETKQKSSESSSQQSSGGESSSETGGSQGSGEASGGQGSSEGNASETTTDSQKNYQKFELKSNGVLTNDKDINWDYIKNEIEIMYQSVPTITIDLYQSNLNRDDILSFNSEYDKLMVAVKNESKQDTLNQLSKTYDYVSKFAQYAIDNSMEKNIIETKSNILKAYAKLDSKDWNGMSGDIKNAIDVYSKLLVDTTIKPNKQYSINKIYISLNELQNAINVQDESVFLIKYKNVLEEMNNI